MKDILKQYAEAYREKHRRHCRESYARKKAREAEARILLRSLSDVRGFSLERLCGIIRT